MNGASTSGASTSGAGGTVLACGEHALLIEVDDLDRVLALDAVVRAEIDSAAADPVWRRVLDVVPAARTLLLTVADPADLARLRTRLPALLERAEDTSTDAPDDIVELPVRYDGPDLAEVAEILSLSVEDVVAAHTGQLWRVAFGGFAPGFAYLTDGDPRLDVPRRGEPRTKVPAGAVGLAGRFSGIYPRSSPGGWQLIGTCDAVLWDVDRDPPALLNPGTRVRFVDEGGQTR